MSLISNEVEKKDLKYITKKTKTELSHLSGESVLITGGAGFLGYYLVKTLLRWNDQHTDKPIQITIIDNLMLGVPDWLKTLEGRKELKIFKKDITKKVFNASSQYSYIIHAASIASPTFYRKYPLETIDANIKGLRNILDYAVSTKKTIKGILFFSSSEVYGDPTNGNIPTPEDYRGNVSCTGPRACYDESKRFGETLCYVFAQKYSLPIKIVRPFNNYGPGMKINDGRVIADFARSVLENKDIVMHSDGSPTRTYCYIADAIIGYIKVLVKGKVSEAYNIGLDNPEISVKRLAELMVKIGKKQFNYTGKVKVLRSSDKEYLTDNPTRRCPDITKARQDLKFNPQITPDRGLYNSLSWYKNIFFNNK